MSKKIGVVGAGLMGAEIALVFALAGRDVLLNDRDQASLDRATARLRALMEKGVGCGFYEIEEIEPTLARIRTTTELGAFADRELVTEAVFEARDVKAAVLKALDEICPSATVIASNTSTIPISTLAAYLPVARRPNFIGTHYFSPVSRMKLVEVIPGFDTAQTTVETAINAMRDIGKTPIRVKDVAGFAVNRMLNALIIEAVKLVEKGVATPEDLDIACRLGVAADFEHEASKLFRFAKALGKRHTGGKRLMNIFRHACHHRRFQHQLLPAQDFFCTSLAAPNVPPKRR